MSKLDLKAKPPKWIFDTWYELIFQASSLLSLHGYIPRSQHDKVKSKLEKELQQ